MSTKRFLTPVEIKNIVSQVTVSPFFEKYYADQLKEVVLNPRIIPKLIVSLKEKHNESLIQPGENVRIICEQSIGENLCRVR